MKSEWVKIVPKITDDLDKNNPIECPNCGKNEIDYIYVGDEETRVGFLQIWCSNCLKGIYISRAVAPIKAKFATFDADLKSIVPEYELLEG